MFHYPRVPASRYAIECVLLLKNVSSYYRMCSHYPRVPASRYAIECVLLLKNVSSYYRMFSLSAGAGVSLTQSVGRAGWIRQHLCENVFSCYRMCSLTIECVLLGRIRQHLRLCARKREEPRPNSHAVCAMGVRSFFVVYYCRTLIDDVRWRGGHL